MSEAKSEIAKIKFQLHLLGSSIDHHSHPLESLVLSFDWSSEDLRKAEECFLEAQEAIDHNEKFTRSKFENSLKQKLDLDFQDVKSVVIAFYRGGQWVDVCKRYAESFGENPPLEIKYGIQDSQRDYPDKSLKYMLQQFKFMLLSFVTSLIAVLTAILVIVRLF